MEFWWCRGGPSGAWVRDVNHDVTQHQHFNVTINHPVPDSACVGEEAHLHTYTQALTVSLTHDQTCCPTFDFLAVVEVDVPEFGFVLEGVQAA